MAKWDGWVNHGLILIGVPAPGGGAIRDSLRTGRHMLNMQLVVHMESYLEMRENNM